jgi:hypothetical protein
MMENKNVAHNRCITDNFYSHSPPLVSKPVLRRQFKVKTDKLIKETNFLTNNEIEVAKKIKTIPNYATMYHVFLSYAKLGLWEFYGDGDGEDICISQNDVEETNLVRFEYEEIPKVHLITEILRNRSAKLAVLSVMESYKFLLSSILLLNTSSVIHLKLDANNLYVLNMNVFQPVIYNFMNAFVVEEGEGEDTRIQRVVKLLHIDGNLCVTSPLEKYIIYYLYKYNEPTLTLWMVETICHEYIENMKVSFLTLFPAEVLARVHSESVSFLIQYIHKPTQDICDEMIKHLYSWDNYGLASLYMFLLQSVVVKFQLTTAYLEDIKKLLWSCLEIIPTNRPSTKAVIEKYNTIFCENISWEI